MAFDYVDTENLCWLVLLVLWKKNMLSYHLFRLYTSALQHILTSPEVIKLEKHFIYIVVSVPLSHVLGYRIYHPGDADVMPLPTFFSQCAESRNSKTTPNFVDAQGRGNFGFLWKSEFSLQFWMTGYLKDYDVLFHLPLPFASLKWYHYCTSKTFTILIKVVKVARIGLILDNPISIMRIAAFQLCTISPSQDAGRDATMRRRLFSVNVCTY